MSEPIHPYAIYTTEEAAKLLRVSIATIQRYIRSKKLQAIQIGKWYRISGRVLIDFMSLDYKSVNTSFQRVRAMEDANYWRSISFLMSTSQGKQYLELFDLSSQMLLGLYEPTHMSDENELTIKYIIARVFNHGVIAYRNALSGYYQASYAMQRDLIEVAFLADYFRSNAEKIAEWRVATNDERISKFSPNVLYKKLDKRDGFTEAKRKIMYQQYCEYATHVSYPGIKLLTNDENLVEIGPFYNENKLINTIHDLVRNFGSTPVYLGIHIKIKKARTFKLILEHMDKFDRVYNLKTTESEEFKRRRASIEDNIKRLIEIERQKK